MIDRIVRSLLLLLRMSTVVAITVFFETIFLLCVIFMVTTSVLIPHSDGSFLHIVLVSPLFFSQKRTTRKSIQVASWIGVLFDFVQWIPGVRGMLYHVWNNVVSLLIARCRRNH
jgi:hypothetical protein